MAKKTAKTNSGASKAADMTVLKNPRITEKAARSGEFSVYVFDVLPSATKSEIAKAFQVAYKHAPIKINTVTQKPKSHFRQGKLGFGKRGKKAYVFLPKGVTIDVV